MTQPLKTMTTKVKRKLVLIGVGNIGSFAAPLLARIDGLEEIVLVDGDVYEEKNLISQGIEPSDVGTFKAIAQAVKLRRLFPALKVTAFARRVEDVPLGLLRADLIVAGLDSKVARQRVNEIAWRLNVPWLDSGVHADGCLTRLTLFVPGETACWECGLSQRDYMNLEVPYACQREGNREMTAPSGASASLGAYAAAAAALEVERFFAGGPNPPLAGVELRHDGVNRRILESLLARNPKCRFDHLTPLIDVLDVAPSQISLREAFALGGSRNGAGAELSVPGVPFVIGMVCPKCVCRVRVANLHGRPPLSRRRCDACDIPLKPIGMDIHDRVRISHFSSELLTLPLSQIGFEGGDVLCARSADGKEKFVELRPSATRNTSTETQIIEATQSHA